MKKNNRTNRKFSFKNIALTLLAISAIIALGCFMEFAITTQQEQQQLRIQKSIQTQQTALDLELEAIAKYQLIINEVHNEGLTGSIIELYNPTKFPVSLAGYGLTNNSQDNYYTFPKETIIQSYDYMILTKQDIALNFDGSDYIALKSETNELLDFISLPFIPADESYGRMIDVDKKYTMMTASIGSSNASSLIIKKEYPVLSVPSGFYNEPFTLEIMVKEGYELYYTTDGSIPDKDSIKYINPIPITDASKIKAAYALRSDLSINDKSRPTNDMDKATIIRVIAIDTQGHKSDIITASYFVGFQNKKGYETLPILSIVTDPEDLFGYWDGIYVTGNEYDKGLIMATDVHNNQNNDMVYANYMMDWERESYYQLFEPNGMITNSGNITLSTYDDGQLDDVQKSLQLSGVQVSPGQSAFNLLLNREGISDTFILSSGRNDSYLKIREILISKLMENSATLAKAVTPVVVFLDGEYWGLYNMVLPYNTQLIADAYALNPEDIVIMNTQLTLEEVDDLPVLRLADPIIAGSLSDQEDYMTMIHYILETDLTSEEAYGLVESMMDIQSFIDMSVCMLYTGNSEWFQGEQYIWKSKNQSNKLYEDGKWRWILTNTESSIGIDAISHYKMNSFLRPTLKMDILFNRLLDNEAFRAQFIKTFLDDASTRFSIENVASILEELTPLYYDQVLNSYERYYGSSEKDLLTLQVEAMKTFFTKRMQYMSLYLKEEFGSIGELDALVIELEQGE